jgi:hypothetical protein
MSKDIRLLTMNTSNSSMALKGASVIPWRAKVKQSVEKDRSPPASRYITRIIVI